MTTPDSSLPNRPAARETETASPRYRDIERWDRGEILSALLGGQQQALYAVAAALPQIEAAVTASVRRLDHPEARLVYAGAGTSGRVSMLDGVELGPTFSWPDERLVFLVAGGQASLFRAQEGAEDDTQGARAAVAETGIGRRDVVIGLAASGATPFTLAAVEAAREAGALTIGIANNPDTPLLTAAEWPILLRTGPEALAGSTRLAAGTSQKVALNLFSTAVMIGLGKVFRGRMVEMRVSNRKLRERAKAMLIDITGCSEEIAEEALEQNRFDVMRAVRAIDPAAPPSDEASE